MKLFGLDSAGCIIRKNNKNYNENNDHNDHKYHSDHSGKRVRAVTAITPFQATDGHATHEARRSWPIQERYISSGHSTKEGDSRCHLTQVEAPCEKSPQAEGTPSPCGFHGGRFPSRHGKSPDTKGSVPVRPTT
eukprot:SAG11_NODE_3538_length_2384_cov_2.310722_3_plen_134_part_00